MTVVADSLFTASLDWSRHDWEVRPVNQETALSWIPRYHYSGDIGHTGANFFGVFCPDLIAVVGLGPATNAYGLAKRFDLRWPGNREITRVAVHPDAPRFSTSRAVASVLRALRSEPVCWVFAYADEGQGHLGGIYQALNAVYLGTDVGGRPPPSWEIYEDGAWRPIASRSLGRKCGTGRSGAIARLAKRGIQVRIVDGQKSPKHTYVLPTAAPKVARAIRRHLAAFELPYPKVDSTYHGGTHAER